VLLQGFIDEMLKIRIFRSVWLHSISSFYSFPEILTPLPFVSHNSSVVSREAAIISGLVGESKDQVQMELDA